MLDYFLALLLTVSIESSVVLVIAPKRRRPIGAATVLACLSFNLLTHPLANLSRLQWEWSLLPIEMGVVVVETWLYWRAAKFPLPAAVLLSITANIASAIVGFGLY